MQKLVWQNANGETIDLTSGSYGITEWEGFSNASLNIQSQQVPFQDGAVFLDALIEPRELSVTLKMQDNNNLELRYQLRRELIHKLNPKLGEGYLIYTNDFISKRIKCVAQIPLFETHNSNDSGTPKASLSWVANEPYWEDLGDTEITFQIGEQPIITNDGDIPCQIEMDWFTNYAKNPSVTNATKNQKIQFDGDLTSSLKISTKVGEKAVLSEDILFKIGTSSLTFSKIAYSEKLKLFVSACGWVVKSRNAIDWELCTATGSFNGIVWADNLNIFVIVGANGTIMTSPDGTTWTSRTSGVSNNLISVTYSKELNLFIAVGVSGTILTSPDGENWTSRTSGVSAQLRDVVYSDELNLFVVIGFSGTILTSLDGTTWTSRTSGVSTYLYGISYSDSLNLFIVSGYNSTILTSPDGMTWTSVSMGISNIDIEKIIYSDKYKIYIAICEAYIYISKDFVSWVRKVYKSSLETFIDIIYCNDLNKFIVVGNQGTVLSSSNGEDWTFIRNSTEYIEGIYAIAYSDEIFVALFYGGVVTSSDGMNWTRTGNNSMPYMNDVTYSKELNLFIAVGNSGTILTSSDGTTWTSVTSGISQNLLGVCYSSKRSLFVAVGSSGKILTSSNGTTWTSRTSGTTESLNSVAYIENYKLFFVVGLSGTIITSPNGTTWTNVNSGVTVGLQGIAYSPRMRMFIITSESNNILVSFDGKNWSTKRLNIYSYAIIYSKKIDKFIIGCFTGALMYSEYTPEENLISKLSSDSDVGMNLAIGDNHFIGNYDEGSLTILVKYRQKYIGV